MPAGDAVGELDRHEQDDEGGQQEEALEEQRQAVERIHLAEGVLHRLAGGEPRRSKGCRAGSAPTPAAAA